MLRNILPVLLPVCFGSLVFFSTDCRSEVVSEVGGSAQFYMDGDSAVSGVGDEDQALYQAQLTGKFHVRFSGLPAGVYRVVVGNTELVSGTQSASALKNYRVFDILADGKPVVEGLNLLEKFGPATKSDVSFNVEAGDGVVLVEFVPKEGAALARMSFVRLYDSSGKLVAEETALSRKPKNWKVSGRAFVTLGDDVFLSFPKKNPEKEFSELKIYDAQGRPWRVAREDWDGARKRAAEDGEWKAWVAGRREEMDKWMSRHHDRVEWVCGWWHDFVSPKDGSFIEWTEDIPGEEVPYLHSRSDSRVEITPKIMGGWILVFRSQHAIMIQEAARLYRLTGEEKYAAWAASQLDFYADHFLEWPISARGDGARLYWQTLDEATALVRYADTVRLLGEYADPVRKQKWKEKFFDPESAILNARPPQMRQISGIHNIATWHRCAVAQVALAFDDEELWKTAVDGEFGLRRQLFSGVTADYIWWEQSLGYNRYLVEATITLFMNAGIMGRASELSEEMAVVENLMLSPIYLRFPDGFLPSPADATGRIQVPDDKLMASTYRIFPTTMGLSAAAGAHNWNTLVDPPVAASGKTVLPEVKSRNLDSIRMALLKSGQWQVFLHYGQLTSSHAQAELMNFSAFYGNTDITHDPGTVGYGSPLHAGYYNRGLNHNVPLVDGEGAYILPQKGEVLDWSENPASIHVRLPEYRPGIAAERTLRIGGDVFTDTLSIKAADEKKRALGMALHLQGRILLPQEFKEDVSFAIGRPDSFSQWQNVRKATYRDRAAFVVQCGNQAINVQIASPGDFTVWHASVPDFPPKRREGFYVEKIGSQAVFTTTFSPSPAEKRPDGASSGK